MLDTGLPTVPADRLYLVRSVEPRLIPKELLKLVLSTTMLYAIPNPVQRYWAKETPSTFVQDLVLRTTLVQLCS